LKKLDHETKALNCQIKAEIYDKLEEASNHTRISKKCLVELAIEYLLENKESFIKQKFLEGDKQCN